MTRLIDGGLRKLFREHVPQFDWCSIETGPATGGVPDSNYCAPRPDTGRAKDAWVGLGIEGWVEYKQTGGWAVTLKPEQVGWICRRVRYGGRVWIAVRQQAPAGPRREARDALWLVPGRYAREARELGLRGLAGALACPAWQGGPARWPWAEVARLLAS